MNTKYSWFYNDIIYKISYYFKGRNFREWKNTRNFRELAVFAFLARINLREFMIYMNFVSRLLHLRDKFETECLLAKVLKGSFSRPRPTAL